MGLAADIIHEGHINILKTAKKYGHVTVGLQLIRHRKL